MVPSTPAPIDAAVSALRVHAPFDAMEEAHLRTLAGKLELAYFPKSAVLIDPGAGPPKACFIIRQGTVFGEGGAGPSRLTLAAGEIFPVGALLAHRAVENTYRAAEDCFCFRLAAGDLDIMLRLSPAFHDFCTRRIANLLTQSWKRLQSEFAAGTDRLLDRPLAALDHRPPALAHLSTPLREVLKRMRAENLDALLATDGAGDLAGIFTLRDLRNLVARGIAPGTQALAEFMHPDPVALPSSAPAFEAAMLMARLGVHHVPVMDEKRPVGLVSETDLFSLQRQGVTRISAALRTARSGEALVPPARDIRTLAVNLLAQGVTAEQVTQLVTVLNDVLTGRTLDLVFADSPEWRGRLCWLAFGSEGRSEQTLATDQDNGLLFDTEPNEDPQVARARLLPLARRVNEMLDAAGYPLCRGDVMASNPRWCLSFTEWQAQFADWIFRGDAEALLNATIFFDFRPLWGDVELATDLRAWLSTELHEARPFLGHMVENALANRPPLGLVRDFVTGGDGAHTGTLDLKRHGITPFVDAARIFALKAGISDTNTGQRLRATGERWKIPPAETEAWVEAFHFIQLQRLRHQFEALRAGRNPDNHLDPETLNDLDRRILKEAFRQARKLQSRMEEYFQF